MKGLQIQEEVIAYTVSEVVTLVRHACCVQTALFIGVQREIHKNHTHTHCIGLREF